METNPIDIARLVEDEPYRLETRLRMQTDLYFLTKWGLGYTRVTDEWHQPVADVFVKKTPPQPGEDPSAALNRQLEEAARLRRRLLLLLPRKTYKALALDTKIPTPKGFVTMGEIEPGDEVFSETGARCKVIGVSPVYDSNKCYEVEFSTGEIVIADAGHLWLTDARRDRDAKKHLLGRDGKKPSFPTVKTTDEIAATVKCRDERNHRVPRAGAIQLPDADLPIAPYVLGCWLGDGGKDGQNLTCADPQIIQEIIDEGEVIRYANCSDPYKYVFNGGQGHPDWRMRSSSFAGRIAALGLKNNKHIPDIYLRGSYAQRLALLQGLMDTDGNAATQNGAAVFSNTNSRLVSQVKELIASLGLKVSIRGPYEAKIDGEIVGVFFQVAFHPYLDSPVFRLKRKQNLLRVEGKVSTQGFRSIKRVTEINPVPVRCIMVDSPSQLYLITDGFIPTHNTTLNIADTVQWIANFPEVAIMVMCASNSPDSPLADAFVAEVASHFYCPINAPRTAFHLCFPEHVITKMPKAGEFTTPARTKFRRDPTVKGVSIEQSLSGWHPDLMKPEDVQDNRNSQTAFALKKVKKNYFLNLKMLGETGVVDGTGTRYGPMDLYGDLIAKAMRGQHLQPGLNVGGDTVIYWKPAYIKKPHALKLDDDDLTEHDVILQFPEQLSWEFLRAEKELDPETYWTQYMNVAEGNFVATFPMERLEAAKVPDASTRHDDKIHICWRFEYAESKHAAGAVGIEHEGRITIVEVLRGQFAPTGLARRLVSCCRRWETHRVEIEDTPGANTMVNHIRNEALAQNWRIDIRWSEFLQDETARALAIKSAEPHLVAGRLLFHDDVANLPEVFKQLYHFGMIEETEMASVIARVAAKLPASIAADDFEVSDDEQWNEYITEDAYNRVYGRAQYATPEPIAEPEPEWEPSQHEDLSDCMPGLSG